MKRIRVNIFGIFLVYLLSLSCASQEPELIEPGKVMCEFCAMHISDLRFHSQIVTRHGKHFHFDSIECALDWKNKHGEESTLWTATFNRGKQIKAIDAFFLVSESRQSPMKKGYSAYSTKMDAEVARNLAGGKIVSFSGLESDHKP